MASACVSLSKSAELLSLFDGPQRAYRRITKTVNGVTTILAGRGAVSVNQWYRLRITAVGNHLQVFVDDVQLFDVTDSSIASGKIGLYVWGEQGAYFDDVVVTRK